MGNRKQSTLSNESYILLTVGSAIVLMLTTIPADFILKDCNITDTVECLLHEIHHQYQHAVIQTLLALKEENVDFMKLQYYKDALGLAVAQGNDSADYNSWETYINNELEVQSRSY